MSDPSGPEGEDVPDPSSGKIAWIVQQLGNLPENGTVRWNAHTIRDGVMYPYGTLYSPELCEPFLDYAWYIVELPQGEDECNHHDETAQVIMPNRMVMLCDGEMICAFGPDESESERDDDKQRTALVEQKQAEGKEVSYVYGWTVELVTKVLEGWVAKNSGRTDLTVVHDKEVGFDKGAQEALDRMNEVMSGAVEGLMVGEGVYVHPDVMDQMLADPEMAAEMTEALKHIAEHHKPEGMEFCNQCQSFYDPAEATHPGEACQKD